MMHRVLSRLLLIILAACASPCIQAAQSTTIRTPPTNDIASMALSPDGLTP
ncbi:MAG: hypothetical protein M3Y79_08290 [Pseudomonadota bacterium]|nr:hypothetical protein [Pseudomonadota bacterium]